MRNTIRIAFKEFSNFFASPTAFIFIGSFIAVALFIFFWVETFFARNIADVRPLFEWMPLLLVFLVAAITMKMWSEERRNGTLEFLLTLPVTNLQLVMGKFLACLGLVVVAVTLTIPLPITVALLGPLDWGPVIGGYLATLFLASAYVAIGLFISARSDNQNVSLIVTTALCGLFYLLGSDTLTGLFGNQAGELLKLFGSGSRFESITRGVIDLRDIVYYLSLTGLFLTLNAYTLEWLRWSGNHGGAHHRRWALISLLFGANFLALNLWLAPVNQLRADVTQGNIYSISDATRSYLAQLREPMIIRGYFSSQTHPLLAPLVPRLRDLLQEYAVAGEGRVRVEFIDPLSHPELEQEANEKFDIKPVPFQFSSKYRSSVVNSYFNVLVQYGDQHEVLGFRDLIEVKSRGETDLDVELRNPEYDLTQSIKRVLYAYQGGGELFDNITHPVAFKGYISATSKLPAQLQTLRSELDGLLAKLQGQSNDKLSIDIREPEANGGALAREVEQEFGFRPMVVGLISSESFWFYMTLEGEGRTIQVPLPEKLDSGALERSIDAALKRFSKGFLKSVALHAPTAAPSGGQFSGGGSDFSWLNQTLSADHNVIDADLKSGYISDEADLLMLTAPEALDERQLFAVDQFLMRGGTVVLATAPFNLDRSGAANRGLQLKEHHSGLEDWLSHHGIGVEKRLVLDQQNSAFPIPVTRRVSGFMLRETQLVDYPYFVDIRDDGMVDKGGISSGLNQLTLTWPSPIAIDEQHNQQRKVTRLLESSEQSWTSDGMQIQPDYRNYGKLGFPTSKDQGRQLLAAVVEGSFDSYFKGKPSPLAQQEQSEDDKQSDAEGQEAERAAPISRVIDRSPDSARIVLFASNSFLSDEMIELSSAAMGTRYLNSVQLMANAVDWSLEDRGLLTIRGRAHFSRTLDPLDSESQQLYEYANYLLALLGLLLIWMLRRQYLRISHRHYAAILSGSEQ